VFTSGATESNNLAIRGVCERPRRKGNHIISVATEHKAILDPLAKLGRRGFEITLLPVRPNGGADAGLIDVQQLVDQLAGAGGARLDHVEIAETLVGVVVVEIDQQVVVCHGLFLPADGDTLRAGRSRQPVW